MMEKSNKLLPIKYWQLLCLGLLTFYVIQYTENIKHYDLSDINTSKSAQKEDNVYIHVYKHSLNCFRNKLVYKRFLHAINCSSPEMHQNLVLKFIFFL